MKVLLVEDEVEMANALETALGRHDIILDRAASIAEAQAFVTGQSYDAVILDRRLPDGDGVTFIPELRRQGNATPVIMLTARGDVHERIEGLERGADDYLGKPFVVEELVARLRALFRRPANMQSDVVTVGRLRFDFMNREPTVQGFTLDLTRRETLVLEAMLRRSGRMVTRDALMEAVFALDDEVQPNALDTQVSRLRRKLIAAECGVTISGVRGLGYMLREIN